MKKKIPFSFLVYQTEKGKCDGNEITEDGDEDAAAIEVRVRFDEAIGGNLFLGHEGSQEGRLVQLEVTQSTIIVSARFAE